MTPDLTKEQLFELLQRVTEALRHTPGGPINPPRQIAGHPLIAAMRCYVASKLGDEVEIPEELL